MAYCLSLDRGARVQLIPVLAAHCAAKVKFRTVEWPVYTAEVIECQEMANACEQDASMVEQSEAYVSSAKSLISKPSLQAQGKSSEKLPTSPPLIDSRSTPSSSTESLPPCADMQQVPPQAGICAITTASVYEVRAIDPTANDTSSGNEMG